MVGLSSYTIILSINRIATMIENDQFIMRIYSSIWTYMAVVCHLFVHPQIPGPDNWSNLGMVFLPLDYRRQVPGAPYKNWYSVKLDRIVITKNGLQDASYGCNWKKKCDDNNYQLSFNINQIQDFRIFSANILKSLTQEYVMRTLLPMQHISTHIIFGSG